MAIAYGHRQASRRLGATRGRLEGDGRLPFRLRRLGNDAGRRVSDQRLLGAHWRVSGTRAELRRAGGTLVGQTVEAAPRPLGDQRLRGFPRTRRVAVPPPPSPAPENQPRLDPSGPAPPNGIGPH